LSRLKDALFKETAMSRHLSRLQAILLGSTVLAVLGLSALGLFAIGGRHGLGGDSFHVVAGFQDIGGVEVGTRVRIQGIDAGEVEEIVAPDVPGGSVRLRLRIAGRLRHLVRDDARVQVISEGLLPGKIVRLVPGRPEAAPLAEEAELTALPSPELGEELAHATAKLNDVLGEVKATLYEFREGQVVTELAQATTRLNRMLTRADETLQAVQRGEGTLGKLLKNDSLYTDLSTTLTQVNAALYDLRNGKGTLGQLVKSNEAYTEAVQSLQEVRKMVVSVKQNADAIKALPVVRNYVVDPNKELIRPNCTRLRKWLPEKALFEPSRAVLTAGGKQALDDVAPWLNEHKEEGSEVVVAAVAAPDQNGDFAHTLTQQQSEAVVQYLKSQHKIHRTGFWWWSNRKVRAIGCGIHPPPVPETERLAAARIELIVFVPE
jgi:phospholipid/cholesterol/gamma-HCH transport system substrate-binding protein